MAADQDFQERLAALLDNAQSSGMGAAAVDRMVQGGFEAAAARRSSGESARNSWQCRRTRGSAADEPTAPDRSFAGVRLSVVPACVPDFVPALLSVCLPACRLACLSARSPACL